MPCINSIRYDELLILPTLLALLLILLLRSLLKLPDGGFLILLGSAFLIGCVT